MSRQAQVLRKRADRCNSRAFIAIVIIIIAHPNDTIQTSEDVERYLGVSTLGIIPLAEGQKKSKKKNKNGRGRKK